MTDKSVLCPKCAGGGLDPSGELECEVCGGTGETQQGTIEDLEAQIALGVKVNDAINDENERPREALVTIAKPGPMPKALELDWAGRVARAALESKGEADAGNTG